MASVAGATSFPAESAVESAVSEIGSGGTVPRGGRSTIVGDGSGKPEGVDTAEGRPTWLKPPRAAAPVLTLEKNPPANAPAAPAMAPAAPPAFPRTSFKGGAAIEIPGALSFSIDSWVPSARLIRLSSWLWYFSLRRPAMERNSVTVFGPAPNKSSRTRRSVRSRIVEKSNTVTYIVFGDEKKVGMIRFDLHKQCSAATCVARVRINNLHPQRTLSEGSPGVPFECSLANAGTFRSFSSSTTTSANIPMASS